MAELNHTHVGYDNFVLESVIEDQYATSLDLMQFCEVDNSLVGVAGDKKIINTYTHTEGNTEILAMGEGNVKNIEVSMEPKEYTIQLYQNRFPWYDEELMRDPKVIETGVKGAAVDMWNKTRKDIMAEFNKASLSVTSASGKYDFAAFVDSVVALDLENAEGVTINALVNPAHMGEIRKTLKDDLKYVEAYARAGYVGTVAGVNLHVTSLVEAENGVIVFIKGAVKYMNKKGSEIENERTDANKRLNTMYTRKYGMPVFADATKAVKLKLA